MYIMQAIQPTNCAMGNGEHKYSTSEETTEAGYLS